MKNNENFEDSEAGVAAGQDMQSSKKEFAAREALRQKPIGKKDMRAQRSAVEVISKYLEMKTKKELPGYKITVGYSPHRTDKKYNSLMDPIFDMKLPTLTNEAYFKRMIKKVMAELERVSVDRENNSAKLFSVKKTSSGFAVYGDIESLVSQIQKNDRAGWDHCLYGEGVTLG